MGQYRNLGMQPCRFLEKVQIFLFYCRLLTRRMSENPTESIPSITAVSFSSGSSDGSTIEIPESASFCGFAAFACPAPSCVPFRLFLVQSVQHFHPCGMSSALEGRGKEKIGKLGGKPRPHDPCAEAEDVRVVMHPC